MTKQVDVSSFRVLPRKASTAIGAYNEPGSNPNGGGTERQSSSEAGAVVNSASSDNFDLLASKGRLATLDGGNASGNEDRGGGYVVHSEVSARIGVAR